MSNDPNDDSPEWLVLVHQIPPKPAYLRVKIGRRLARIGAVALKNSVYLLPAREACQEDFEWVVREVRDSGGEATLMRARVLEGLDSNEVLALFNDEREHEYQELLGQIRQFASQLDASSGVDEAKGRSREAELVRLERRLDEIGERDFFGAPGRELAGRLLRELRLRSTEEQSPTSSSSRPANYVGRTWVTRGDVGVDRIASAWLIQRFIDPDATFKFVAAKGYHPDVREVRFDMFDAEFTHEGQFCTFEVLCLRFGLTEPGVDQIGKLVHDLDVKDDLYELPESAGFAAQVHGITLLHGDDEARLRAGSVVLDALLRHFAAKTYVV